MNLTVIIPLFDDRGHALQAIQSWLAQRSDEYAFSLVVVDAGRKKLAKRIHTLLGPQDRIVTCSSSNEAELYNSGVKAATTSWMLLTESHVLPANDCIKKLASHLKTGTFDLAILGTQHQTRSLFSKIDAALFETEYPEVRRMGLWRCVGLRGLLIRRSIFESLGCLNPSYDRFSETTLAIHAQHRNYSFSELKDVELFHVDTDSIGELKRAMRNGRVGSCRFFKNESSLAEQYFGQTLESHCEIRIHPQTVLKYFSLLWQLARNGHFRAARRSLLQNLHLIPVALLGWRGLHIHQTCKSTYTGVRFLFLLLYAQYFTSEKVTPEIVGQYRLLREQLARHGTLQFLEQDASELEPILHNEEEHTVTAYTSVGQAIGFFGIESYQGEPFRWSEPTAALQLNIPAGAYTISMDIRPTGDWKQRKPHFFLEGQKIAGESIRFEPGKVVFSFTCQDRPWLAWTCKPFRPKRAGLPDQRTLGVAFIGLKIQRVISPAMPRYSAA